jgi:hypothetical protein
MSKVNDALKRVRDTQQSHPRPADTPSLRSSIPLPAPAPTPGIGLMPIAFAVVAFVGVLGLILLWRHRHEQIPATRQPVAVANPAPAVSTPAPTQVASVARPKPPLPAVTTPKARVGAPVAPIPAAVAPSASVIKLQGILYSSHNPSAMISGQTVTAGDEIKGYRVSAIGQHSVTLVKGTQTNMLSLGR